MKKTDNQTLLFSPPERDLYRRSTLLGALSAAEEGAPWRARSGIPKGRG
jgi:hypothetical protein